ncbi:hypothetical protein IG631_15227 [Alternaria alternata]|nr:hypothetical protein IG631_15227 [Alternaria alternata]
MYRHHQPGRSGSGVSHANYRGPADGVYLAAAGLKQRTGKVEEKRGGGMPVQPDSTNERTHPGLLSDTSATALLQGLGVRWRAGVRLWRRVSLQL